MENVPDGNGRFRDRSSLEDSDILAKLWAASGTVGPLLSNGLFPKGMAKQKDIFSMDLHEITIRQQLLNVGTTIFCYLGEANILRWLSYKRLLEITLCNIKY